MTGKVRQSVPANHLRMRQNAEFEAAREILRDKHARQAGFKAELIDRFGDAHAPILYLSGEAHRRQRAATARFFAPKLVATRYRDIMEQTSDRLIGRLCRDGRARLDTLGLELAVTVAAEIVGLTDSEPDGMTRRLDKFLHMPGDSGAGLLSDLPSFILGQWRMLQFYLRDVRPSIVARRRSPREDVITHLIAEGYSDRAILTECVVYAAAGMATTREFIAMAAWHLLDRPDLRTRFLDRDDAGRIAILEEILRLEPVVGTLHRRLEGAGPRGEVISIDIRSANTDEAAVGACPHRIDPDRQLGQRVAPAGLAFGDGPHRCPGAAVALQEAAIFLDKLLRVAGLHLEREPIIGCNPLIAGYELRDVLIRCDKAGD
jgi:cytochrome P450